MQNTLYSTPRALVMLGGFLVALSTRALAAESVDFNREVRPILELHCLKCHGPEKPKGKLQMSTMETILKGGDNGAVLVAGNPDGSKLYTSTILASDHQDVMHPAKEQHLSKEQSDVLKRWVAVDDSTYDVVRSAARVLNLDLKQFK